MYTKFLADIHCNRIVYFTEDIKEELALDDNLFIFYTDKPLPDGMTLKNCWNWKWNTVKEELVYSITEKNKESRLEQNRRVVYADLKNLIDTARKKLYGGYLMDDIVQGYIFRELHLPPDQQLYITAIAEAREVPREAIVEQYTHQREKVEDILFLTEITKVYFTRRIEESDNLEDLYKIRNDIIATNFFEKYKKMREIYLTNT